MNFASDATTVADKKDGRDAADGPALLPSAAKLTRSDVRRQTTGGGTNVTTHPPGRAAVPPTLQSITTPGAPSTVVTRASRAVLPTSAARDAESSHLNWEYYAWQPNPAA